MEEEGSIFRSLDLAPGIRDLFYPNSRFFFVGRLASFRFGSFSVLLRDLVWFALLSLFLSCFCLSVCFCRWWNLLMISSRRFFFLENCNLFLSATLVANYWEGCVVVEFRCEKEELFFFLNWTNVTI